MSRDDIICMAIDAGARTQQEKNCDVEYLFSVEQLERLLAAENEACAKVCETLGVHPALNVYGGGPDWYKHGKNCADAIRARGKA